MTFDFTREPGKKLHRHFVTEKQNPLITVVTPFYNAGRYFEQTFHSVMNQTFPWFEWIIVDDGSTDQKSIELLNRLSRLDARITVYTKENGGISTARNLAIKKSNTEYIIPLDADDLIEPTFFECLYFGLYFNKEYDWAYTNSVGFDGQEYTWDYEFDAEKLKTYNFLNYVGIIRKSALLDVGLYDESERKFFEDWHMWLRLLAAGHYPVRETFYGFWYRRTDTGVLSQVTNDSEQKKRADALIRTAADKLDSSKVMIKDYHRIQGVCDFEKPSYVEWPYVRDNDDRIHILMIFPWMQIGGADAFNLEFVKLIDKRKYKVSIVTTKPNTNPWRQKFEEYVDEIYDLPSFLDTKNFSGFISYLVQSRDTKVVFLSQSYYGYYLMPWLKQHFPDVVLTDYMHIEEKYWRNGGYARTTGAMGSILDMTYTCNEVTRKSLIENYGRQPDSVKTVYIGVDQDKFSPYEGNVFELREKLGLPKEKKLVLFPCRIMPQKRPLLMVEIARKVAEKNDSIAFVVVGNGQLFETCSSKIQEYGLENTVYMLGEKELMQDYYHTCDLTLICSMKEGLALTAYESLSCGKPVISADVGGQKELIDNTVGRLIPLLQDEGEDYDSDVFPQEEIDTYVDSIFEVMDDEKLREQLGSNGRSRIENGYSTTCMCKTLLEEFDRLLNDEDRKTLYLDKNLVEDYLLLYNEYSMVEENVYGLNANDTKSELMRIANSKLGRRLIKLAFKLRLNKLFS